MKSIKNKKIIFIIVLLLVVSSTIAFLYSTDTFQNIFVAASYRVKVTEEFVSPDNWVPGDVTPKTVTLKNEGTVPIKVRVKLEEEWKDSNGVDLPLTYNDENVAIINLSNEDDYIYRNGYYYYDLPLEPGKTTSSIIESVTFNPNYSGTVTCEYTDDYTEVCSSSDSSYEGGTYKLTITIEGVQEDYYVEAWGLSGLVQHQYLYNVLKDEAESNGLARKYTGEHHDSFVEEPSKDIYHWYADSDTDGTEVQNKNNVVFADHCWQMIRTTDTGGVKMIYNGEAVDNQCLSTRGTHVGYESRTFQNLASNYWYGTDYTYDSVAKTFKLSGTTEQVSWNAITGPNLIDKYTCKSTNVDGTCSTLYLVESYYNTSSAYVIPLNSNSNYSQFGVTQYNKNHNSPSYVGYMYGDVYTNSTTNGIAYTTFEKKHNRLTTISLSTNYWYADSVSYDYDTGEYSLVDPYKINLEKDYPSLVGKYTFRSSNETATHYIVTYIAGVSGSTMYCNFLTDGYLSSLYDYSFGDSITDNGDGTYTINNATVVTLSEWYTNYSSYYNKYTCNNSTNSCENPRYITAVSKTYFEYLDSGEKIMIGKSRSGTTLIDTILVRKDELIKNYNNYSDYKYTCNTESEICTEASLKLITECSTGGFYFAPNHYYGSSVTWDGTNYILQDTIEIENYNNLDNISTHHYICPDYGEKVCSTVGYVYYYTGSLGMEYILLKNGVTTVSKAMEDMFTKNTYNSSIKNRVDTWYKHYLLEDYDNYIEDTIFCNDRSIKQLGGWDDNGGLTNTDLQFKEYSLSTDLSCTNVTDRFSISNSSAKLTYKVGLMSGTEMNLLNNNNARKSGKEYWLISPYYFNDRVGVSRYLFTNGGMDFCTGGVGSTYGVRPAISLKSGIEYTDGDGSMENPYIVNMD